MSIIIALRPTPPPTADEERLLEAILDGWQRSRLARGHRVASIAASLASVRRLCAFTGKPPWRWGPADMDDFSVHLRESDLAYATIRGHQLPIHGFLEYATDPAYPWLEECRIRTGFVLRQICTPENTIAHAYGAPSAERRALDPGELHAFFTAILIKMEHADRAHCKGRWTTRRDYGLFQLTLAFGARDHEAVMSDVRDLPRAHTPKIQKFSAFEGFDIRFGKASNGGPPKQRFVPAIPLFRHSIAAVDWYLRDVRSHLATADNPALFPSERGERMREDSVSALFAEYRDAARLDPRLTYHCLRHTFASMLVQANVELGVVSKLLGHTWLSTTQLYTHVPDEFVRQRLLAHHDRLIAQAAHAS